MCLWLNDGKKSNRYTRKTLYFNLIFDRNCVGQFFMGQPNTLQEIQKKNRSIIPVETLSWHGSYFLNYNDCFINSQTSDINSNLGFQI